MANARELWYEYCQRYCNNDFGGVGVDDAPASVRLAVDKLVSYSDNKQAGINSRTIDNIVVESYSIDAIPADVKSLLLSYRKMRW